MPSASTGSDAYPCIGNTITKTNNSEINLFIL